MKLQLTILFVFLSALSFGQAFHGTGVRVNKGVILQNGDSSFSSTPGGIYINPTTGHIRFYQGSGFIGLSEPPEIGHKADSSAVWKRTGISNLGTGNIIIRKTTTGNVSIENADGFGFRLNNTSETSRLGDDDNYFEAYAGNVSGFILDSDSLRFTSLSNQEMLITDKRSSARRWGLRYAGDYSTAIRGTPNALTTMKTVRDVIDSINFITFSDTVDLIATKADISGISGDYWPLSGNFSTTGAQTITTGGNFTLTRSNAAGFVTIAKDGGGEGGVVIRKSGGGVGDVQLLNSGTGTGNVTIQRSSSGLGDIIIDQASAASNTNINIVKQAVSSGNINISNQSTSGNITINNSGIRTDSSAVNELRLKTYVEEAIDTLGSGGVDEAYVSESVDSVRQEIIDAGFVEINEVMDSIDSVLDARFLGYKIDTVNIQGWNMDADQTKNVTLPVTNANLIAVLDVVIYHDGGTTSARKYQSFVAAGVPNLVPSDLQTLSSTTFQLVRGNGGYFDSEFFDDDTINRGYMVIMYIP